MTSIMFRMFKHFRTDERFKGTSAKRDIGALVHIDVEPLDSVKRLRVVDFGRQQRNALCCVIPHKIVWVMFTLRLAGLFFSLGGIWKGICFNAIFPKVILEAWQLVLHARVVSKTVGGRWTKVTLRADHVFLMVHIFYWHVSNYDGTCAVPAKSSRDERGGFCSASPKQGTTGAALWKISKAMVARASATSSAQRRQASLASKR